jgi:hypothetical protein
MANLVLHLQDGGRNDFRSRQLIEPAQAVTAADGHFTFLGIPHGQYVVWALVSTAPAGRVAGPRAGGPARGGPSQPDLTAAVPVTVGDADVANVQIVLRRNAMVSGRVEFDGLAQKPASLATVRLLADVADGHFPIVTAGGAMLPFQVDASGQIAPRGLAPGQYFVRSDAPPPGWTLKSATVGGRDVSDDPLTIDAADASDLVVTFTDHPTSLTGSVRTSTGAIDPTAVVLVFPVEPARWIDYGTLPRRFRSVPAGPSGTFSIAGLPGGDYFVIATPESAFGQWQDPASLQRAARLATRTHVVDGPPAVVNVRTATW